MGADTGTGRARAGLYHLGEDSARGERLRAILRALEIEIVELGDEHLGETIGRLMGTEGAPAAEPAPGANPDADFLLLCGLPDGLLDRLLAEMNAAGVRIDHKAVVTAHNRDYRLGDLVAHVAEEHAVVQVWLALDRLAGAADKLPVQRYGRKKRWNALQTALSQARSVLKKDEPELELVQAAHGRLKRAYLSVIGQEELTGTAVLTLAPAREGGYTVAAAVRDGAADAEHRYRWSTGAETAALAGVPDERLAGLNVTVTAPNAYGFLTARLEAPAPPRASLRAEDGALTLRWDAPAARDNCPPPVRYRAAVYREGALIREAACGGAETALTVEGLEPGRYTVKLWAENPVGRSDKIALDAEI